MSARDPPPYLNQGDSQGTGVKAYHVHTPFTPPGQEEVGSASVARPVYTSGGGGISGGGGGNEQDRRKYVSYDVGLGRSPGMATCTACQQQVMTNIHYKAGTYAWLMCILFICCGLFLCCCLIPFFLDSFKDAYHTCPRCQRVLHVEKKECCK
ncbi:lipopolysaccharide-induced tumor necrosis factor-alpha factor homolog-like [Gambusia affinis]|uniref:lipopolysaccharide-induced tumor necrosis factor-alpha factor homolog-like n=1 Tax=Gambusia affinis TaxID=33528 RepID=UPI001CDC8DCB|nr:lipopolysaccharide-induced tumor necrosis factor-alpha factor homolog-like [Gambusia affinis]